MSNKTEESKSDELLKVIERYTYTTVPLALLILSGIYFYFFHDSIRSQESFALFGDYIGGLLNPFLSFLAVVLLILSIRYQVKELSATRLELKETKDIHNENLRLTEKNIKSQENLFALQTMTDDMKELSQKAYDCVNATTIPKYSIIGSREVELSASDFLGVRDEGYIFKFNDAQLLTFLSSYEYVITMLHRFSIVMSNYLSIAQTLELKKELMPFNYFQTILIFTQRTLECSENIINTIKNGGLSDESGSKLIDLQVKLNELREQHNCVKNTFNQLSQMEI